MAPTLSLNMLLNVKIVTKAGTAHGSKKITPKIRFPLINGWFAMIAVKIPITIWAVEAQRAQIMVQPSTEPNAVRKVLNFQIFVKLLNPTQSSNAPGGKCLKS